MAETNQQRPEGEISRNARPNVFIAVKVESPDILNAMASVQEDLVKLEPTPGLASSSGAGTSHFAGVQGGGGANGEG